MSQDYVMKLSGLDFQELRETLRKRLEGFDAGGPALDPRGDVAPYNWIAKVYVMADTPLRERIDEVLVEFLGELQGQVEWPDVFRTQFFLLLQLVGGPQVSNEIHHCLSQRFVMSDHDLAASLLKCLLARQQLMTPKFWMDWFEKLGSEYGGLILAALVEHGADTVSANLHHVTVDEEALDWTMMVLPELERRWGRDCVRDLIYKVWHSLTATAQSAFGSRYGEPVVEASFLSVNGFMGIYLQKLPLATRFLEPRKTQGWAVPTSDVARLSTAIFVPPSGVHDLRMAGAI